jgi:hypothetical protein
MPSVPILIVVTLFPVNVVAVPVLLEGVVIRVQVLSLKSLSEVVKLYMKAVRDLSMKTFGGKELFSVQMPFSRVRRDLLVKPSDIAMKLTGGRVLICLNALPIHF